MSAQSAMLSVSRVSLTGSVDVVTAVMTVSGVSVVVMAGGIVLVEMLSVLTEAAGAAGIVAFATCVATGADVVVVEIWVGAAPAVPAPTTRPAAAKAASNVLRI
jgi:hypothetical protein